MLWITERLTDGIVKAKSEDVLYEKGQVIYTRVYNHEIMDYVRIPWWIVHKTRKTKKGQNLILLPYQKFAYVLEERM